MNPATNKLLRKIIREELLAINNGGKVLNENYGQVLDKLQRALDKATDEMRGTSVLENGPIDIWIDLGVRNQFCDENGKIRKINR